MYFCAIAYTFFIISSLFGCRNYTFLLSFSQTRCFANLISDIPPLPPVQCHSAMQSERYHIEMLLGYHWLTCCCCFDEQCILFCESEMVWVICAGRFQRSALYSCIDSKISHSNECIIHIVILCDISTSIVSLFTLQLYIHFFAKGSYFNLNAKPANQKLALHHNLTDLPPTCINSSHQHLISLPACPASKQELLSSWKKRGAMAVTSGLLGLNNTWRTTIIVGQWLAHVGTQLLVLLHLYRYSRMPLIHAANMAASFVG
jgi:hypothetical protein